MLPSDLKAEQFSGYPPKAKALVVAHLEVLRQLPLSFMPSLLREIIDYDYRFPAERKTIDSELAELASLSPAQRREWFQPFSDLSLSQKLERVDWVNQPAQFTEQLSAYLWSTHQMDAFRKAATEYGNRLQALTTADSLPVPRLGIAIIGQGVTAYDAPLFRNLRKHGTYFTQIKPDSGVEKLLAGVAERAEAHPVPYGHWYIDGGQEADHSAPLTCTSYRGLEPMRAALLKNIQTEIAKPGMGPEELRTHLAQLAISDIGVKGSGDVVLDRFQMKIFTEGSGTQIFSTTFAQWTTREVLRRAQALTVLVRFAPRQRQKPMNELLANGDSDPELDAVGSLVDADMGSYYHWLNQQRLPGWNQSSFLVWFEGHDKALAIGPSLPRNTESSSAVDLAELLRLATT
jgi:hypothetical protein